MKKRAAAKAKRAVSGARAPVRAMVVASPDADGALAPRPRIRLRAAMRKAGLDEWKIGWLLNYKIDFLAESKKSSDNKLLLDYLKEAARHLDPASAHGASLQEGSVELVHNVPRPNRNEPEEQ